MAAIRIAMKNKNRIGILITVLAALISWIGTAAAYDLTINQGSPNQGIEEPSDILLIPGVAHISSLYGHKFFGDTPQTFPLNLRVTCYIGNPSPLDTECHTDDLVISFNNATGLTDPFPSLGPVINNSASILAVDSLNITLKKNPQDQLGTNYILIIYGGPGTTSGETATASQILTSAPTTPTPVSSPTPGPAPKDILSYYRSLGEDPNVVETTELLKAADDWSNNRAVDGFTSPITTQQLLALADEWAKPAWPIPAAKYVFIERWINIGNGAYLDFPTYIFDRENGALRPYIVPAGRWFPLENLTDLKVVYGRGTESYGINSQVFAITDLPFTEPLKYDTDVAVSIEKIDGQGNAYLRRGDEQIMLKPGENWTMEGKSKITNSTSEERISNYGVFEKSKIQLYKVEPSPQ
jgi:hypothetical protein